MAITMLLPEDATSTPVAFDLPKTLAPYLREFYEELKREGETLDAFICRFMCEQGVHFVQKRVTTARDTIRRSDIMTDDAELGAEASMLLLELP